MKVVILNSGMGTRMGVLTKEHPKCMTDLSESETILSAQLKTVVAAGLTDVVITTGYFNAVLVEYCTSLNLPLNIEYVYNPLYSQTNYIYSLYCAKDVLADEDIILLHGDMVFEPEVFKNVLACGESCMATSSTLELPQKDFKAVLKNGRITAVGIEFFENAVAAQPLYKLLKNDWNIWLDNICNFCESEKTSCYAENAMNEVTDKMCLRPLDVKDALCNEIDNADDLLVVSERYRKLCK